VHEPGFVSVRPGSGEIMIAPVSVCHHVSTMGQRPPPITSWYQSHGLRVDRLADRPEQPQLDRSCLFGYSSPHLMHARIAVGAV
jgi:hypothetical protein